MTSMASNGPWRPGQWGPANPSAPKKTIEVWAGENATEVERTSTMISEFRATGTVDIARLALANRIVRGMLTAR